MSKWSPSMPHIYQPINHPHVPPCETLELLPVRIQVVIDGRGPPIMARGMKGIIIIVARIGGKLRDKFLTNKLLIAKSCPSKVVVVGCHIYYIYIGKATSHARGSCWEKLQQSSWKVKGLGDGMESDVFKADLTKSELSILRVWTNGNQAMFDDLLPTKSNVHLLNDDL